MIAQAVCWQSGVTGNRVVGYCIDAPSIGRTIRKAVSMVLGKRDLRSALHLIDKPYGQPPAHNFVNASRLFL